MEEIEVTHHHHHHQPPTTNRSNDPSRFQPRDPPAALGYTLEVCFVTPCSDPGAVPPSPHAHHRAVQGAQIRSSKMPQSSKKRPPLDD